MNRKLLLLFIVSIVCLSKVFSQAPLAASNPNYVHDKITDFYVKSADIKLPDSVYRILKDYARNKNYKEVAVLRNDGIIKIFYNKNISLDDRLYACNFFIKANTSDPYPYVPLYFLKAIQLELIAKK